MTIVGGGQNRPRRWPLTIGVALPLPPPFSAELGAFRERFGDPWAHAIVTHVTLVPPLTLASPAQFAAVQDHLRLCAAAFDTFGVELAGSATFLPLSPVVYVPLVVGEDQVRALEALVRSGPLACSLRFPFHPHVTVVHDVTEERLEEAARTLAGYRARFEVDALHLFARDEDRVWRELRAFPLGDAASE